MPRVALPSSKSGDGAFPKSFAGVECSGGSCGTFPRSSCTSGACLDGQCAPALEFPKGKSLPLGLVINNAKGESTGDYLLRLRVFRLLDDPLQDAVLAVVENADSDKGALLLRRATVINGNHDVLWTGDLMAFGHDQSIRYTLAGRMVSQHMPGTGAPGAPCRLALVPDASDKTPGLLQTCGTTQKMFHWKGRRFE